MRKQSWTKRDPIKNYFPLPNEIYDLGLSRGAISVYSFLLRREDKTYQCLLSYREIGEGVGMCVTTVRKYVAELEERSLIRTERTTVTTKDGRKRNGRLLYHILPIQLAIDQYYERQMDMADLALEQQKAKQRLAALERKECVSGCVTTKDGRKRNGRLLYHILPIQLAIDQYYERQMDMADLALEQHKAKQRLAALERKECASGC